MKKLNLHLRTFFLCLSVAVPGDGYSCPYGQACFEPAPRGRAPMCAQPGLTYCVHPDPYPEQVIRQLIEAGQYDIRTLLSDESRDDFNARKNDYPYGYGPNSLPNVDQISLVNEVFPQDYNRFNTRYNNDIFSQKTPLQPPSLLDPSPYNIKAFRTSNFTKFGFHGYHNSAPGLWNQPVNYNGYDKKTFRQNNITPNLGVYNQNFFDSPNYYSGYDNSDWLRASNGVTQYNPNEWWKYISPSRSDVQVQRSISFPPRSSVRARKRRNAELVKAAAQRQLTGAEALRIALGLSSAETSAERPRRQAANTQELCRVRTEYITPRAALNNRGSWRYVVNMPNNMTQLVKAEICILETQELCRVRTEYITPRAALNNRGSWRYVVNMPNNMTQLVKAEICMSNECSGLCTVPQGYTSRCEQKYIQKRLVALESSGQNLYTDVFWIPSCCQCTIVNQNS